MGDARDFTERSLRLHAAISHPRFPNRVSPPRLCPNLVTSDLRPVPQLVLAKAKLSPCIPSSIPAQRASLLDVYVGKIREELQPIHITFG